MTPENEMIELMGLKQGEDETLRDYVRRYNRTILKLGPFNHLQALRALKEEVKIKCL